MNQVPMPLAGLLDLAAAPRRAESLGVRPGHLRVVPGETAAITDAEPLGGFTTLGLDLQGTPLRATLRGQPQLSAGARVGLAVDPGRARFYDAGSTALAAQ